MFGIGDLKEPSVQQLVAATLRRVQTAVANVIECGKIYRNPTSWFQAFAAFQLPAAWLGKARTSAEGKAALTSLRRICDAVSIVFDDALPGLKKLAPRAEFHKKMAPRRDKLWGKRQQNFPN